jgi:hypothetical protein
MIRELLEWGGIGALPVQPEELAGRRAEYQRRRDLLSAHLAHVEATAPAHAAPHRDALAKAEAALAWLTTREAEEKRRAEWSRTNPPGGLRDIKETIDIFLGR